MQIKIQVQSILQCPIESMFTIKLFNETSNCFNYRCQLSNYAKRQLSKNKEAAIRWRWLIYNAVTETSGQSRYSKQGQFDRLARQPSLHST